MSITLISLMKSIALRNSTSILTCRVRSYQLSRLNSFIRPSTVKCHSPKNVEVHSSVTCINKIVKRKQSSEGSRTGSTNSEPDPHDDITAQIKSIIDEKIKPLVQEDGGDLEFVDYKDKVVRVRLQGACTTCPSSTVTLQNGVKNMLQYYIPEVEDVEQVLD